LDIRAYSTTAASNTADFPEGMAPSAVNDEARELQAEIAQILVDEGGTLTTGGSSNAYTLTLSTTPASLADGLAFSCTANHTNTGAATLVVTPSGGSAFTSKKLRKKIGAVEVDIVAGDIGQNAHLLVQYDSAADSGAGAYLLLNPAFPNAVGRAEITSAVTLIAFTLPSGFTALSIKGECIPTSGASSPAVAARVSTNSGSSYASGASDYRVSVHGQSGASAIANADVPLSYMECSRPHATTNLPLLFHGVFYSASAGAAPALCVTAASYSSGQQCSSHAGWYITGAPATNIRFEWTSGTTFAAGTRILIEVF
jgi:hypothetical protein